MDKYKLKFTKLQQEIFRLLCIKAGAYLSLREIAKLLKVSPTAVSKAIKGLKQDKLIKVKEQFRAKLVSFNYENVKAVKFKMAENIKLIVESGLIEFLENHFAGATIILFGSYARGEDNIDSDIDIAIIGRKEKFVELKKFEKFLERKIYLHFFNSFNQIHNALKHNIYSGIVLEGVIQLK